MEVRSKPRHEVTFHWCKNFSLKMREVVVAREYYRFCIYSSCIIYKYIILKHIDRNLSLKKHFQLSNHHFQGDCDVEWKFARTRLWVNYIDEGSTLPVPFNMIPTPKSLVYIWQWLKEVFRSKDKNVEIFSDSTKRQTFIKVSFSD